METRHKEIYCDLLGCSPETNTAHYCVVPELDAKPFTPSPLRAAAPGPRVDPSEGLYQRIGADYAEASIQPRDFVEPAAQQEQGALVSMCETCWDFHGTTASCAISCGCHFEKVPEKDHLFGAFIILACAAINPEAANMFPELVRALELLPDGLRENVVDNPAVAELLRARAIGAATDDADIVLDALGALYELECGSVGDGAVRIEIEAFITENDLDAADPGLATRLRFLQPGQEYKGGGGAAPEWTLRRIA